MFPEVGGAVGGAIEILPKPEDVINQSQNTEITAAKTRVHLTSM